MRFLDVLQRRQSVDRLSHLFLRNPQLVEALQVVPKKCASRRAVSPMAAVPAVDIGRRADSTRPVCGKRLWPPPARQLRSAAVADASGIRLESEPRAHQFVQYDTESQNLGASTRLRWTFRPGKDVFIVWNRGWKRIDLEPHDFNLVPDDQLLAIKLQWTFRK